MIISASRRTDIPAFYAKWLLQRLAAGYVEVRNPFNAKQVRRVSLAVEDVDAIVFWTRNPAPLLRHLDKLQAYQHVWLMTITGMARELEPAAPKLETAIDMFQRLCDCVGAERLIWRFDPIFISSLSSEADCLQRFAYLAERLSTSRVIISFADIYGKVPRNMKRLLGTEVSFSDLHQEPERIAKLAQALKSIAARHDMQIQSCAQHIPGIESGACIDGDWLRRVFDLSRPMRKDSGQRAACACVKSIDIGAYNTCGHACVYCYATEQTPANRAYWRSQPAGAALR
jgi:DNA repair photolyase